MKAKMDHVLATIKWDVFEDAITEGAVQDPQKSLEECLQDAFMEVVFPGAPEAAKQSMREYAIELGAAFVDRANDHINEVLKKPAHSVFDVTKDLLRLIQTIGRLPDAITSALCIFKHLLNRGLPHVWRGAYNAFDEVLFWFDETALSLCKQLPDIASMQLWRIRLMWDRIEIQGSTYSSAAFLIRTSQYLDDSCIKPTAQCLVDRIAGQLPQELADIIFHQVLVDHDIPLRANDATWAAVEEKSFEILKTEFDNKSDHCCLLLQDTHNPAVETLYWSTIERRYIRFHAVTAEAFAKRIAGSFKSGMFFCSGENMEEDDVIFARCRGRAAETRNVSGEMVFNGPLPCPTMLDEYFESDHGVGRVWRLSFACFEK